MADIVSNQLARQLTEMVDNFTLLDILSKEEQEERRALPTTSVEADKASASGSTPQASPSPKSPSGSAHTTSPPGPASPVGSASPTPADDWNRQGAAGGSSGGAGSRPGSGRSGRGRRRGGGPPSPATVEHHQPPSFRSHQPGAREIELINTGSGLGFGLVEFKGKGVAVKTIVKGGAAAVDGRLETGDILLSINETDVQNLTRDEVVDILKQCGQGSVRLVITREMVQAAASARPPPAQAPYKRDAPRGGRRGGSRGGGHPRDGRKDDRKEWEEKKQANIDAVEAEIQAMREAYEAEKNAGGSSQKSVYSFLDDPRRMNPSHTQEAPPAREGRGGGGRHEGGRHDERRHEGGSRRSQHSWGGQDFDHVVDKISKSPRGRGGTRSYSGHASPGPQTKQEMLVTMTGKERMEYEQWKQEREKIDKERIARHKQHTQGGDWSREWDKEKDGSQGNGDSWNKSQQQQAQRTWSSRRADNYRDIRVQEGSSFDNQPPKNEGQHPPFKGMEVVRGRGRPRGRSRGARGGRGGGRGSGDFTHGKDTGSTGPGPVGAAGLMGPGPVGGGGPMGPGPLQGGLVEISFPSCPPPTTGPVSGGGLMGPGPVGVGVGGPMGPPPVVGGGPRGPPPVVGGGPMGPPPVVGSEPMGPGPVSGTRPTGPGPLSGGLIEVSFPPGKDGRGRGTGSGPVGGGGPMGPGPISGGRLMGPGSLRGGGMVEVSFPPGKDGRGPGTGLGPVVPGGPMGPGPVSGSGRMGPLRTGGLVEVSFPPGAAKPGPGIGGGCPPERALAQPIGIWQATDESDVTRPRVPSDDEQEPIGALRVQISPAGAAGDPLSPLSPGGGWTTPTDHTHVVDWAAEANNNSNWELPPTSPSNAMYDFNPNFEAAASASQTWGGGTGW